MSAVTDSNGKFVLTNAPVGNNIPLVMQVGKWRRQITIHVVTAGVDNPQTDKNQTRLPGKTSEGDMPLIAFTSVGCDIISLDETQSDLANDVGIVTGATWWIYKGTSVTDPNYLTKYLTFNTPVGNAPAQQCGRAEFTEFHLDDFFTTGGPFPGECGTTLGAHANNEAALEFLFFDLSSCVQDDTQAPVQPN